MTECVYVERHSESSELNPKNTHDIFIYGKHGICRFACDKYAAQNTTIELYFYLYTLKCNRINIE